MKFLFDLFPVILFVAAYMWSDSIYVATAVIIPATVAQVAYQWLRFRKVDKMLLASMILVVVMGGLTLFLHDDRFIIWKPTLLYWLFAVVLALAPWLAGKNLIRAMLDKGITAPDRVWKGLNLAWVVFFVCVGFVNLYVAENYSRAVWVQFKLWGITGLLLAFVAAQVAVLYRYVDEADTKQ